ncbi:hypothetical protein PILCRDRAFT_12599 [Piloderma croceum F 1598]|uniref:Uncharacterized protein n=1 Tax=Piloderma croceum (strain F 1598) TaxID=765440 RepID=A0A0C3FAG3_PILCF|nr:hypothetical protein PILCRDRAFT_12599 [Piloderma croceum F 1598]
MKLTSVLLSVVLACGLATAAPSEDNSAGSATAERSKIVTFYDQTNYTGQNYTLFNNRLHYCVDFTRGPLVVSSAKLFDNTVCDLYTEQGCGIDSYVLTIAEDTPNTGLIDQFSMHCTTVVEN